MMNYKTLRSEGRCTFGRGKWRPGKPRRVRAAIVPCQRGIHFCTDKQVVFWVSDEVWEFVDLTPDETLRLRDKCVTRSGKVTRKYESWNARTAKLFAIDACRIAANIRRDELSHLLLDTMVGYVEGYVDELDDDFGTPAAWNGKSFWLAEDPIYTCALQELGWQLAQDSVFAGHCIADVCNSIEIGDSMRWSMYRHDMLDKLYGLFLRYLNGEEGPLVEEG